MISSLNKLPDGTIELTITIPTKKIKESYQKILTELGKKAEIKGFRKGKAPKKLVEEKLGKSAIYEEVLKDLIPQVYAETIKEHKLKPIISPQIQVISLEENKDWQIKASTCELPDVELGDYKGEIRKSLAADKIWVPGKDKKETRPDQITQDKHLTKIFDVLLKSTKIKIPAILIEDEVNRMLSRLLDQTNRLGLTIEQYLTSIGKTSEQIRSEYKKQAEESLKLELIISQIAENQKVKIEEKEVDKMIQAVPDEQTRKKMETPVQRAYVKQILRKRAVIDNLMKL